MVVKDQQNVLFVLGLVDCTLSPGMFVVQKCIEFSSHI